MLDLSKIKICIVGLGYVGLPLAVEFGKKYKVVGFDINQERVQELVSGYDSTLEVSDDELAATNYLEFSSDIEEIKSCNLYIVTVPTLLMKVMLQT